MQIRQWAKGHWPQIIAALVGTEFADGKHHACPGTGEGKDRFRFSNFGDTGGYFCACSGGDKDGFDLLQCVHGWTFAQAAEAVEGVIGKCPKDGEESKPRAKSWASKLQFEVVKTDRSAYLQGRGLEIPKVLDWHKSLPYFDDDGKKIGQWPAMLAPVMRGGEFVTYHVTYLQGGQKAPVNPCRKILPGSMLRGAGVPLYAPQKGVIGVAEGIESAIAAKMIFGVPTHAALNTALLKAWQPPAGVEGVIIYADNDANHAGQAAAHELAHRLIGQKIDATVTMPDTPDTDWNDELLNAREAS